MKIRLNPWFFLALVGLAALSGRAAVIPVSSLADTGPGTLRSALAAAADGDTIDATSLSGTIRLTSGELAVNKNVIILGPGPASLAVDGNGASRVLHIGSNTVVDVSGLTITNGYVNTSSAGGGIYNDHAMLTVRECTITGNFGGGDGGGVFNNGENGSATLQIASSTLSKNRTATYGGAAYNAGFGGSALLIISDSLITGGYSTILGGGIGNESAPGGSATVVITNSTMTGNSAVGAGGCIFNRGTGGGAAMLVANCALTGNSASGLSSSVGGAIYNDGTMTVSDCTLRGNSASGAGGGAIANARGTLTVVQSTLSGNSATNGGGGAIENENLLTVSNCLISGNSAYGGGGIQNYTTLTLVSSTLSGNSADFGGGIANGGSFNGDVARLTIVNSTLSGNLASGFGGGGIANVAYGGSARLKIVNSTLSGNAGDLGGGIASFNFGGGAAVEIGSSILHAGASGANVTNSFGTITSDGYNVSSDDGGAYLTNATDYINTDPLLGPLQDNGGPTFTHALLPGSPAIDKGKNFSGSSYDQRGPGFARTFDNLFVPNVVGGDGTDIGAFEVQNLTPVTRCMKVTVLAGPGCAAAASIDNGSSDPDGDPISLSQSPPGPYPPGTNIVLLTATDAYGASDSCSALVIVLGPRELLQGLLALVNDQVPRSRPLLATLEAALSALDRHDLRPARNELEAFQHQVRAQVTRSNPALAQTLLVRAQQVVQTLDLCGCVGRHHAGGDEENSHEQ